MRDETRRRILTEIQRLVARRRELSAERDGLVVDFRKNTDMALTKRGLVDIDRLPPAERRYMELSSMIMDAEEDQRRLRRNEGWKAEVPPCE